MAASGGCLDVSSIVADLGCVECHPRGRGDKPRIERFNERTQRGIANALDGIVDSYREPGGTFRRELVRLAATEEAGAIARRFSSSRLLAAVRASDLTSRGRDLRAPLF
jgi:hypothetical protein